MDRLVPEMEYLLDQLKAKMGIKGSATCVLNFDDAVGYMIGPKR